jgi:hypothetical protein
MYAHMNKWIKKVKRIGQSLAVAYWYNQKTGDVGG